MYTTGRFAELATNACIHLVTLTVVTSIVPRITCANLLKSSRPSPSVTAIGFKGQRNNNNRGGGRRPGFEATFFFFFFSVFTIQKYPAQQGKKEREEMKGEQGESIQGKSTIYKTNKKYKIKKDYKSEKTYKKGRHKHD